MIINSIIVVFCLFMIFWWSTQGFFSSLLQLIVIITAGACTLALWEPLMMSFLIKTMPFHARAVSFMSLFVLFMVIFRAVFDGGVRQNVHFNQLINFIGGGTCGLLSGILTAGMMLIGLSFLPVSAEFLDYQAYIVGPDGKVNEKDHLWIPVDRWTTTFFNTLSAGAFSTETPLRDYTPDLVQQTSLYRMRNDVNSSLAVIPGSVEVKSLFYTAGPRNIAGVDIPAGNIAVAVQTKWSRVLGTFDGDNTLRLPPAQIRLATRSSADSSVQLEPPISFSYFDPADNFRYAFPCNSDQVSAYSNNDTTDLTYFFSIPQDRVPLFFLARLTRIALPEAQNDGNSLAELIGGTKSAEPPKDSSGNVIDQHAQRYLTINEEIPMSPRSKNALSGTFEFDDTDITAMIRGKGDMRPPEGVIPKGVQVTHIKTPKQKASVRYLFTRERAREFLGAAVAAAASLEGLTIKDNLGNIYQPIGYCWVKDSNTNVQVSIDPEQPITSMRQFPSADMRTGEELWVYFQVNRGVHIIEINAGKAHKDAVDLVIPDK